MILKLEPASPIPIYLQIMEQVRHAVASGLLHPDDELPSVRALASRHLINPNTVARAYLELEREGLVTKKRGTGTFISHKAAGAAKKQRTRILTEQFDRAIETALDFGLSKTQARSLFEERLKELSQRSDPHATAGD